MIKALSASVIFSGLAIVCAVSYKVVNSKKVRIRFGKYQTSWDRTDEG